MNVSNAPAYVFGEVLFDHFPGGERVLGGAPFNVAWHLQAFGNRPQLISRVGDDEPGREVLQAMQAWGMSIAGVQIDHEHPTGQVAVELVDHEPRYQIVPDCAYDFIAAEQLPQPESHAILYHGTLGLRSQRSRHAFLQLLERGNFRLFLDVNLRPPWWQSADVADWLARASWVKLNQDELRLLGYSDHDCRQAVVELQQRFSLEQVILTLGAAGALVQTIDGTLHQAAPEPVQDFADTVGAGDAFSAVYLHGLLAGWSIAETLTAAQRFAGKVITLRGATTSDPAFYLSLSEELSPPRRAEQPTP